MGRINSRESAFEASRGGARPSRARRLIGCLLAAAAGALALAGSAPAQAQEIQLTGPLAGAPAVRKLRLHREKRLELAPSVSFTLLDEYQRTILPGLRAQYHFTDWLGVGVWGGFGIRYTTALTDELQDKAINARRCDVNSASRACTLTAVNLTKPRSEGGTPVDTMKEDQLGQIDWIVAPQVTVVPFRGKLALFSSLFVDTDVNIFAGPAFIGLKERAACGFDSDDAKTRLTPCSQSFMLDSRVAVAPTFGLGLNFYPSPFIGFGAEWRGIPFSWNTSGFDNKGGGSGGDFPDTAVNSDDRAFHFNSMMTLNVLVHFPNTIKTTD